MKIKKSFALTAVIISLVALSLTANSQLQEYPFDVNLKFELIDNDSPQITIQTTQTPPEDSDNPLEFIFSISYNNTNNLDCTFAVDSNVISTNLEDKIIKHQLSNGNHSWVLNCVDPEIHLEGGDLGTFTINENFSASLSKEVYLLDEEGNLIGGNGNLQINSAKDSKINIKIHKPSSSFYEQNMENIKSHSVSIGSSIIEEKGTYKVNTTFYRLASPLSVENEFYVAEAKLSFSKSEIETGEEVTITSELYSPVKKIKSVIIDFGDGNSNIDYFGSDFNEKTIDFKHKYQEAGDYNVELKITIEGSEDVFTISRNGISVESSEDTERPSVTLIYPSHREEITQDSVTLKYRVEDNVKIKNCTFELYNYSEGIGTLDYSKTHENLNNNQEVEIPLKNFHEGRHSWNVYCCDNSSNCNDDLDFYREFTVVLNSTTLSEVNGERNYSQKQKVENLISKINQFSAKTEAYDAEEKEILEDLEISKDLEFCRKRLNQIDQDLGHNIKFIDEESKREQREKELIDEIEEIKEKIPVDVKIIESKEFVKNSLTKDMKEIIQDYMDSKNMKIEKSSINKLAELNIKAQNYLVVSTKVRQIEIDYSEYIKELTLVTKSVDLKNNTFSTLLEIIPKEVAENASDITFLTPSTIIKEDPIFEISVDDLENEKIVYYINKPVKAEKIQDTDTIIFKEFAVNNLITGFFILDSDTSNWIYYVVFIFFIIVIAGLVWYYLKNRKIQKWKKEENVVRVFSYIKEANSSLERKDVETAKEKYHKIKELYPLIPLGCQKYLKKKIDKIRIGIDKKEIFGLVKEFETAKREQRKQDAEMLYKNVQSIYKRLPKKYQKRVYERLKL